MMPQTVPAMTAASALLFASILHAAPRASLEGLEPLVDAVMASAMEEEHSPGAAGGHGLADVESGWPFSAAGRSRIGFAENKAGRVTALSAGSWKVFERSDQGRAIECPAIRRWARAKEWPDEGDRI